MSEMGIMKQNALFKDLTDQEYIKACKLFHVEQFHYKKNSVIHTMGEILPFFGLVISGAVGVFTEDYDGRSMLMAHVTKGATFGESLCYLRQKDDVRIVALTDVCLMKLHTDWMKPAAMTMIADEIKGNSPYSDVPASSDSYFREKMRDRFVAMLARRTLEMNRRIQILSKPSIRQKLITMFSFYVQGKDQKSFTIPFSRENLAAYLGCDRSALSRELMKMKNEGLIEYDKNWFSILSGDYLPENE